MRVFISWSGPTSSQVARSLHWWLPHVLQYVHPFYSEEDIEKGQRWQNVIGRSLGNCSFGVICLDATNLLAPWINFEAGALSAQFEESSVVPFLRGISPADLTGPLSSFNASRSEDEGETLRLVRAINARAGDEAIPAHLLEESFQVWWPLLSEKLSEVPEGPGASQDATAGGRENADKIDEILVLTRRTYEQRSQSDPALSAPVEMNLTLRQAITWSIDYAKGKGTVATFHSDEFGMHFVCDTPLNEASREVIRFLLRRGGILEPRFDVDVRGRSDHGQPAPEAVPT